MPGTRLRNILAGALFASAASLATGPGAVAQEMEVGLKEYMQRCAACHGPQGRGDGPMADMMKVAPRDLTTLSRENDGIFPFLDVYRAIDGRRAIRAHGTSAMPLWGNYFTVEALAKDLPPGMSAEQIVMGRILSIVYYLQAIQIR